MLTEILLSVPMFSGVLHVTKKITLNLEHILWELLRIPEVSALGFYRYIYILWIHNVTL